MSTRKLFLVGLTIVALMAPAGVQAAKPSGGGGGGGGGGDDSYPTCRLPESNSEGLEILSNYYPGYWWDHTDITVAVQSAPNVDPVLLEAVHDAIGTWNDVLVRCFDGLITLTDVTETSRNEQKADIVLHYVPTGGGVSFGGYAICGEKDCPNILVTSDLPPGKGGTSYDPEYMEWLTLHELGHALGLGHSTNLLESIDLMGYGWPDLGDPILSQCDVEALAFIFAWALEGTEPAEPEDGPFVC